MTPAPSVVLSRAAWLRIAPYAVFVALLALGGMVPADGSWGVDGRWFYVMQLMLVAGLLLMFWREYGELHPQNRPALNQWLLAVGVGLVVFWGWTALDAPWMRLAGFGAAPFRPVDVNGEVIWPLVAARWAGTALIVPIVQELFWRSFLMRWIERAQFELVDPRHVGVRAIVLSSFVFTLTHEQWLAAAIAGLAYAALYRATGRLWAPVVAHAVTNAALGGWVVLGGHWAYW